MNYILPGYTETELIAFEQLNQMSIPTDLRNHLLQTKTILRGGHRKQHFVDLYEGNPFSFSNNWIRNGNGKVYLPITHSIFKNCTTKQITDTTKYWKNKYNEDIVEVDMNEYLFQMILQFQGTIFAKIDQIVLMQHGCGEHDALNLNTGIVECRDYYKDTWDWYYREYSSFTEWEKHTLGEHKSTDKFSRYVSMLS